MDNDNNGALDFGEMLQALKELGVLDGIQVIPWSSVEDSCFNCPSSKIVMHVSATCTLLCLGEDFCLFSRSRWHCTHIHVAGSHRMCAVLDFLSVAMQRILMSCI